MKNNTIGPKLKAFRKKRKLSQGELAKALGYSGKSVIAHIEKGDADMTYEKLLLLIRNYMVDANVFFEAKELDKLINEERKAPKHEKVVVYIHGLKGSYNEYSEYTYLKDYDIKGLDYKDGNPWELKDIIRNKFKKLIKDYKEVVVIANSIGAFYAYRYLSDFNIKQAFFISPIADMLQIIYNLMMSNSLTKEELKQKKILELESGETISYDFLKDIEQNNDNWNVPTEILYGSKDNLVYLEHIATFLENHPDSRLTIKSGAKHYMHTEEEKEFIKNWILKNIK